VAKKKSKSAKTSKVSKKLAERTQSQDSMLSKVEIKKPDGQERISRIVGTIFIFLGIALIGYGIYSFIRFSRTPELDETLDIPSLSGTKVVTNAENIAVKGVAESFDEVFVYVDNEEVARVKVDSEGAFEYEYPVEDEGMYAVSVAGVKGFPKRYISLQSDMRMVEVDRTDPELTEIDYPEEVGTESFTLVGNVEPNAEIVVTRGTDKYVATCDEKGDFKITEILLEEGPNVFGVSIVDEAGNEVELDEKVKVTYSMESDVNGNAVMDEIPVASGELEEAMQKLLGNNLMMLFGLIAIVAFFFSSGFAFLKYKGKEE
jgi:hypothetical protein